MWGMFHSASSFNQNLCAWGSILPITTRTLNAFLNGTSCPTTTSPSLYASPAGPFCHVC